MAIPTTNKVLYNPALSKAVSATVTNYYPFIGSIPQQAITSERFSVRRETGQGGVQWYKEGDTISAGKDAATWDKVDYTVKRQVADIELDTYQIDGALSAGENLVARSMNARATGLANSLAASVYNAGRLAGPVFDDSKVLPLRALVDSSNAIDAGAAELSFEALDALLLKVRAKGGQVDFITMGEGLFLDYQTLWRSLSSVAPTFVWTNPYTDATRQMTMYNGVPIFATSELHQTEMTTGLVDTDNGYSASGANKGSVYAGTFDSGIEGDGIAFKFFAQTQEAQDAMGMSFRYGGMKETTAQDFWRFEQRLELVTHHKHAVARLFNVAKNA